jgi:hypothetical protein
VTVAPMPITALGPGTASANSMWAKAASLGSSDKSRFRNSLALQNRRLEPRNYQYNLRANCIWRGELSKSPLLTK